MANSASKYDSRTNIKRKTIETQDSHRRAGQEAQELVEGTWNSSEFVAMEKQRHSNDMTTVMMMRTDEYALQSDFYSNAATIYQML